MDTLQKSPLLQEYLNFRAVHLLAGKSPYWWTVVVGSLILLVLYQFFNSNSKTYADGYWHNEAGARVKKLPGDSRVLRFVNGSGLSEAGKALAGDEPYLVQCGNIEELVICKPSDMQEFLHKDYKDHHKAHDMNLGDYVGRLYRGCLGEQNGQQWKTMRSHFDPDFSHQSAVGMVSIFSKEITQWIKDIRTDDSSAASTGVFDKDVVKASKLISFRLISLTLYGEAFNETMFAKLQKLNKLYGGVLMTALTQPRTASKWYNMLPTAALRQMNDFLKQWRDFNLDIIGSARERGLSCPAERIYKGVDLKDITELSYLQTLIEILFANIDITGLVLASLLGNMSKDSAFQQKLREEIGTHKGSLSSSKPSQADIFSSLNIPTYVSKQDSLLHHLTLEAVRLVSHVHFSPAEHTALPKRFSNYLVPPNTPVIIDVHRLNTHPSVWGSDALVFRPERFENLAPAQYRYGLMRFGIASGRCLGKNMADLILKMVAIAVVEMFDLEAAPAPSISAPGSARSVPKGPMGFTAEVRFRMRDW